MYSCRSIVFLLLLPFTAGSEVLRQAAATSYTGFCALSRQQADVCVEAQLLQEEGSIAPVYCSVIKRVEQATRMSVRIHVHAFSPHSGGVTPGDDSETDPSSRA